MLVRNKQRTLFIAQLFVFFAIVIGSLALTYPRDLIGPWPRRQEVIGMKKGVNEEVKARFNHLEEMKLTRDTKTRG